MKYIHPYYFFRWAESKGWEFDGRFEWFHKGGWCVMQDEFLTNPKRSIEFVAVEMHNAYSLPDGLDYAAWIKQAEDEMERFAETCPAPVRKLNPFLLMDNGRILGEYNEKDHIPSR